MSPLKPISAAPGDWTRVAQAVECQLDRAAANRAMASAGYWFVKRIFPTKRRRMAESLPGVNGVKVFATSRNTFRDERTGL